MIDILDETVNVFIIDDVSSIYIPSDTPFASELAISSAYLDMASNIT